MNTLPSPPFAVNAVQPKLGAFMLMGSRGRDSLSTASIKR